MNIRSIALPSFATVASVSFCAFMFGIVGLVIANAQPDLSRALNGMIVALIVGGAVTGYAVKQAFKPAITSQIVPFPAPEVVEQDKIASAV